MSKKKLYSFDDHPEHREQLAAHRDKWIANAMSTKPMDDHDRAQMRIAIKGLYESAGLVAPPENRIVFVPSPFTARFAGGFAASIWHKRKNKIVATYDATSDATIAATYDATSVATIVATRSATYDAVSDATSVATSDAVSDATYDATRVATSVATDVATRDATDVAVSDATSVATSDAVSDATYDATRVATSVATDVATRDATSVATDVATRDATSVATIVATRSATYDATVDKKDKWYSSISGFIRAGVDMNIGEFGFKCAKDSWRMYQGGNFWSAWDSFLSFFQEVAKLDIDYSKYNFWKMAAIHGSYRIMHPDFCIVSDRPRVLKVDEQNRPHCEDGAFCQWSDGMSLYAWHGVRVPEFWIMEKHRLTPEIALKEQNLELRRAACEIVGWAKIVRELNGVTIDRNRSPQIGELVEVELPDAGKERFLFVECGTLREFALCVPPTMKTALEANQWTYFDTCEDLIPEVRT